MSHAGDPARRGGAGAHDRGRAHRSRRSRRRSRASTRVVTVVGFDLISGTSASNGAFVIVRLKPWDERPARISTCDRSLRKLGDGHARACPKAIAIPFNPPALPGFGQVSGFSFMLQARGGQTPEDLAAVAATVHRGGTAAPGDRPHRDDVLRQHAELPVEVDRDKTKKLGVPVNDVFTTLQTFLGGYQVNDFTRFGRNYKVTMQAEAEFRQEIATCRSCSCATTQGDMVPLDTLDDGAAQSTGARFLQRYNLYRTAAFSGAPGARRELRRCHRGARGSRGRGAADRLRRSSGPARAARRSRPATRDGRARPLDRRRVPVSRGALRELGGAVRRAARDAVRLPRRADRAQAGRHRVQRLRPDRAGHADRALRQERDPDRRVRASSTARRACRSSRPRSRPRGCACGRS